MLLPGAVILLKVSAAPKLPVAQLSPFTPFLLPTRHADVIVVPGKCQVHTCLPYPAQPSSRDTLKSSLSLTVSLLECSILGEIFNNSI